QRERSATKRETSLGAKPGVVSERTPPGPPVARYTNVETKRLLCPARTSVLLRLGPVGPQTGGMPRLFSGTAPSTGNSMSLVAFPPCLGITPGATADSDRAGHRFWNRAHRSSLKSGDPS